MGQYSSKAVIPAVIGASAALFALTRWYNWSYRYPKGAGLSYGYSRIFGHAWRVFFGTIDHEDMNFDIEQTMRNHNGRKTTVFAVPLVPWIVFTADHRNVEYILKTQFDNFPKGPRFLSCFHQLLGDGIFNADGDTWYHQRKTSSPMFSLNVLRHHYDVFSDRCKDLISVMQNYQSIQYDESVPASQKMEMMSLFNRFTLECIGEIGFGVKIGCLNDSDHPFLAVFDDAQALSVRRISNPIWQLQRLIGAKDESRIGKCVKEMDVFTYGLIKDRRRDVQEALARGEFDDDRIISAIRKAVDPTTTVMGGGAAGGSKRVNNTLAVPPAGNTTQSASSRSNHLSIQSEVAPSSSAASLSDGKRHRDFLSLFIAARPSISDRELRDSIVSILIAGRDTTAQTLVWCIWELLQHPDIVAKIRAEIGAVMGEEIRQKYKDVAAQHKKGAGKKNGSAAADLSDVDPAERLTLPSFDQCRSAFTYLSAVVHETLRLHPPVPRNPKQSIKDCTLPDGTFVPGGSLVLYVPYVMNRLEEYWGTDRLQFRPERWLEMEHLPSNYVFPVFQGGPRECLGRNMALLEVKVALFSILTSLDLFADGDISKHTFANSATLGMDKPLNCRSEPFDMVKWMNKNKDAIAAAAELRVTKEDKQAVKPKAPQVIQPQAQVSADDIANARDAGQLQYQ